MVPNEFGELGREVEENPFEFEPPNPGGSGMEEVENPPEALEPGLSGIEEVVKPEFPESPEDDPKLFE